MAPFSEALQYVFGLLVAAQKAREKVAP